MELYLAIKILMESNLPQERLWTKANVRRYLILATQSIICENISVKSSGLTLVGIIPNIGIHCCEIV